MNKLDFSRKQNDIRELEAAAVVGRLVGEKAKIVLNIGPSWGRDTFFLTEMGKTVLNFDIAPQTHLQHFAIGDASGGLPYRALSFDAVVIAEVLEHMIEDFQALVEIRRVLKDNGRLVVTVPLLNDVPDYHVRVHTPKSIVRLLNATGFQIRATHFRGGFTRIPRLAHGVRKVARLANADQQWDRFVLLSDSWLGQQGWFARFANGMYLLAEKSDVFDYRRINAEKYGH
jgi:SAM-dependent methyltransferase